ncbi:39S ribosomal protein L44, mitochondrial-like [Limulus polyphemus]|uniref:Large ribosomal subunit protein mL44 n=1 Tax=Limulus polyphemus TaxID=6850 RepID=A0ABM1BY37_LIMPO|nr:39S ribosomal protein L44, mitochondrial-like [Limulus polyphemus]
MASSIVSVVRRVSLMRNPQSLYHFQFEIVNSRSFKRWVAPTLKIMKHRRKKAGPEPLRHRSVWLNWNYTAELYAFGRRLNETFRDETLRTALIHPSYLEQEEKQRQDLGVPSQAVSLKLEHNSGLVASGESLMNTYIKQYIRQAFPKVPEEGICEIWEYLVSVDVLSHVATHIGLSDIILCADFPPEKITLAKSLKAIIGALEFDQSKERAEYFIQDFVITQLSDKCIFDLWDIPNPMAVLQNILEKEGKDPAEPRLLWQAGSNTILALYYVGIYSNRKFLGKAPGETLAIAEEMAARDALSRIFGLTENHKPLPFGKQGRQLIINNNENNSSLSNWMLSKSI